MYDQPVGFTAALDVQPRLESWDRHDAPSQVALRVYLAHIEEICRSGLSQDHGLGLRLNVGISATSALMGAGGDLDNYLYPVVRALGHHKFVAAFGEKRRGRSDIAIGLAKPRDPGVALTGWHHAQAHATASSQSTAWKQEIADQIGSQVADPAHDDRGVSLHICFRLSARRNWAYLWKPAIDSLSAILGETIPGRPFHPRDDRILQLGLHRVIDDSLGNAVALGIWWQELSTNS